jgi:hypothetical protein
MTTNPILEEIYTIRQQILAECRGDTAAYLRDANDRLLASGRPIAKVKQRRLRDAETATLSGPAHAAQSLTADR